MAPTSSSLRSENLHFRAAFSPVFSEQSSTISTQTLQSQAPKQAAGPRRLVLPTRYMELEPRQPLSAIDDDPIFNTRNAAVLLGVTAECLKKWRARNQGPDFIQYGFDGPVRYALSALRAYREANTISTRAK